MTIIRTSAVLLCVTLALTLGSIANAQGPSAAIATTPNTTYTIAGQDTLSVTVLGFQDLTRDVVVLPDGTVALPLIGSVSVAGKTTMQVEQTLTTLWSKYVVNPTVSVALTQKHQEFVTFSGSVSRPGPFDYRPDLHVVEALEDAGGALTTGDLSKVTVTSVSGQRQVLDLTHPETKAGTDADVLLDQNDNVNVPVSHDEVTVVGEVGKPGSIPWYENMTVLNALNLAGNPLEDGDTQDATLLRGGVTTTVNVYALLHGDSSQDTVLLAGDVITIPEGVRTYVYGAVGKQGYYALRPGDRILDALDAAGGPAGSSEGGADLAKVRLIRISKTKQSADITLIDLQKFLDQGVEKYNVALQPGDVLYVPSKKRKGGFGDVLSTLSPLNLLASTAVIVSHGL